MKNAKRLDARITVGGVPDEQDLEQLRELGYKTIVDVREDSEKFAGAVEKRSKALGLRYVSIPIQRDDVRLDDVLRFFHACYEKGSAPLYLFSRQGRKPLAFLLLFQAVAEGKPLVWVFHEASRLGIDLWGDLSLQDFLIGFYNAGCIGEVVETIRDLRPDLLGVKPEKHVSRPPPRAVSVEGVPTDSVTDPGIPPQVLERASPEERWAVLSQRGCTIWLTGLPGTGKTTTAVSLERRLLGLGFAATVLDSSVIRGGVSANLGHSPEDRAENVRRAGEVARLLADAGLMVIASLISPYSEGREHVARRHREAGLGFFEVHVSAPLEVCERRDTRGLFTKAFRGGLSGFTGVDAPYEAPAHPAVLIDTVELGPEEAVDRIVSYLESHGALRRPTAGKTTK